MESLQSASVETYNVLTEQQNFLPRLWLCGSLWSVRRVVLFTIFIHNSRVPTICLPLYLQARTLFSSPSHFWTSLLKTVEEFDTACACSGPCENQSIILLPRFCCRLFGFPLTKVENFIFTIMWKHLKRSHTRTRFPMKKTCACWMKFIADRSFSLLSLGKSIKVTVRLFRSINLRGHKIRNRRIK